MFITKETLHQTLASIPVFLAQFIIGIHCGWVAPTLYILSGESTEGIVLTSDQCSWIAGLHMIGRSVGAIICPPFTKTVSRSKLIFQVLFVGFMLWPTLLFRTSVPLLYAVRIVVGLAVGILDVVAPIYMGENCSPKLRGIFGVVFFAFFYGGELVAFTLPLYATYRDTIRIYSVLSGVMLLSAFLLKEPAQYFLLHNQTEKAEKNFLWLRGQQAKGELEAVKKNVLEEKAKTTWAQLLRSPENYRSLRVVIVINLMGMLTGYSAVNSYAPITFSSRGNISVNEFLIMFGFVQFCSVVAFSYIIERFKRRTLMLVMAAVIVLVQASTAALYHLHLNTTIEVSYFEWLIFGTITGYASIYGMSVLPMMGLIRAELMPQSIKWYGSGLSVAANSLAGFCVAKIFFVISETYGIEMNFIGFAAMSLVMFVYVYVDLPETKSKTLTEIQDEFKKDLKNLKREVGSKN